MVDGKNLIRIKSLIIKHRNFKFNFYLKIYIK